MNALEIRFDPVLFGRYIKELHEHLFDDESIEEIMKFAKDNHRKRRFTAMFVLQSKDTFEFYHSRQNELDLEHVFDQVIAGLNQIQGMMVKDMRSRLGVEGLAFEGVTDYAIKEFRKDLASYAVWQRKKERRDEQ